MSSELQNQFAIEIEKGISSLESWQNFAKQAIDHRSNLKSIIENELICGRKSDWIWCLCKKFNYAKFLWYQSESPHMYCGSESF